MILALQKNNYFEMRKDEFKTKNEMNRAIEAWDKLGYNCYTT